MTKILIITAVIDLNEPDKPEEQQPPVPDPKPFSPDTLLRLLSDEVRKEHNHDEPDKPEEQQPPVPDPKPFSPDTLLRLLRGEVRKEHNHDIWKNINGTFFKG
jgi:hypothetical protein